MYSLLYSSGPVVTLPATCMMRCQINLGFIHNATSTQQLDDTRKTAVVYDATCSKFCTAVVNVAKCSKFWE